MLNKFIPQKEHEMYLGNKRVKIDKLTINKCRQLFQVVDKLPGLLIQVFSAPAEDFYAYLMSAIELAFDEVTQIVSMLTGLDEDYIRKNVGVDELIEYFTRTIKLNNLDRVFQNGKSLLPFGKDER